MLLIVGLGNIGKEYQNTRHNVGFMILDEIANYYNFSSPKEKFKSSFSEGLIGNSKVFLLKPLTYMNNSGIAVREFANFYKIALEDVFVIHDDIDLDLARVKAKVGGGHGGHNGLRSIDSHMGKEYTRLRFGVDRPKHKDEVSDFVLSNFSKSEQNTIQDKFYYIAKHIDLLLSKQYDLFMTSLA